MTGAPQSDHPPESGWTTDDLDALPEDGRRRELLDRVLLTHPSQFVGTGEPFPINRLTPRVR